MKKYINTDVRKKKVLVVRKSSSIWKPYTRLYSLRAEDDKCKFCGTKLSKSDTLIPISESKNLLVKGCACTKCNVLYTEDALEIMDYLQDNDYAKGFYVDNIACWCYSKDLRNKKRAEKKLKRKKEKRREKEILHQQKLELLEKVNHSFALISVVYDDKEKEDFIITDKKNNDNDDNNIIHYLSPVARELLTAAFVEKRKRRGVIEGKNYCVYHKEIRDKSGSMLQEKIMPSSVTIKKGGGYSSSIISNRLEIIDLLLYSPYKDIYECIHATYDKEEYDCYLDISLYRSFVRKYGNPGILPYFENEGLGYCSRELNEESVLKIYGYSVAKKENLSSKSRHELLAEIVDLEILTIPRIVNHLDFCILTHPGLKDFDAVEKWKDDKKYIESYKINPTRFLIAKAVIKK